ncbi:hypothetical protein ACKS0A_02268 [Histoplasma ohiense]
MKEKKKKKGQKGMGHDCISIMLLPTYLPTPPQGIAHPGDAECVGILTNLGPWNLNPCGD